MMVMKMLFLCLSALVQIGTVMSQSGSDAKRLRTDLMVEAGYDKNVLPLKDQEYTVEVYVNFFLLSINGLDEVTETLTTTGYLWVDWTDEYLVWDPYEYGGIEFYYWPQDEIWKPDVTLRNSVLEYKELGSPELKIGIYSDGTVNWYPFQVFQSSCDVDITYFPFDIQTCHLVFVAWSYTSDDITMLSGSSGIDLDEYSESPVWELVGSSVTVEDEKGEARIKFTIKLKRKPLFFILSILLPLLMLTVLNVFVFILLCESGERAGYAITVFLALAVFLTIISESLPRNSETVAIFAVYVIIQILQSTITTLLALVTIRLSTKETEVPPCLVRLTNCVTCLYCKHSNRRKHKAYRSKKRSCLAVVDEGGWMDPRYLYKGNKTWREAPYNRPDMYSDGYSRGMPTRSRSPREHMEEVSDESYPEEKVSWSLAVRALDVIFFVFFLTTLIVSTVVCYIVAALN